MLKICERSERTTEKRQTCERSERATEFRKNASGRKSKTFWMWVGHTVLLCEEEVTSNELALTCSDCTRTHTLNAAEKSLTTNTILCPYHFNRLAKSAPADPETLRKAKFLVDRVTELQTTTGATLENSLSWLGVPAEEYERCLQIAETEMM